MLTRIDELIRPDHCYLDESDVCYFRREYTSRKPYQFSETNQLIFNLKKSPDRQDRPYEWRYKTRAIEQAASELRADLDNSEWLKTATLVPVPPSKAKSDPLYDDRMVQVARQIGPDLDVRDLVIQIESTRADHAGDNRRLPHEIASLYRINEEIAEPCPRSIGIVDDLLVTGAHFKAMKMVLAARFPGVRIVGLALARRVFASPFEQIDLDTVL